MASSNFLDENNRLPCSFNSTSLKFAVEYMCLLISFNPLVFLCHFIRPIRIYLLLTCTKFRSFNGGYCGRKKKRGKKIATWKFACFAAFEYTIAHFSLGIFFVCVCELWVARRIVLLERVVFVSITINITYCVICIDRLFPLQNA